MANGTYGIRKPASVNPKDVEIFYYYRPSRSTESPDFGAFKQLDSNLLIQSEVALKDGDTSLLPGMYDLRLPLDIFGEVGVYTIYIKPKEIRTKILHVSTLAADAYSDIRGIVLDMNEIGENADDFNNGNLVGYRVEYFDDNGARTDTYRIITSNFRCEPVTQYLTSTSQNGTKYRYNDSSSLVFCTLTPSASMSFKSNSLPFIGKTGQKIALINTKFNPVMMEVEIVEHDDETIATMLEGDQTRNLEQATITTFTKDGGIYHQADYGNITNSSTGLHHDFKFRKDKNINYGEIERLQEIKENV